MNDATTMTVVAWSACAFIAGACAMFAALQSYARLFAKSPVSRTWLSDRLSTTMAQSKDVGDMVVAVDAQRTPQLAIRVDAPAHDTIDPADVVCFTVFNVLGLPERVTAARTYVRRFILLDRPARVLWKGDKRVYSDLLRAAISYGLAVKANGKDARWSDGLGRVHARVQWLAARNVRV